jgi:hypothetical protein
MLLCPIRHDTECADGGQRTAVVAIKLVDSIAVNNQFPLVAARQVKVAHQAIARILSVRSRGSYTRGHWSSGSEASYSRGSPHRASDMAPLRSMRSWVVREDALAVAARGGSGSAEAPGRVAAALGAWSYGDPASGPLGPGGWIQPAW